MGGFLARPTAGRAVVVAVLAASLAFGAPGLAGASEASVVAGPVRFAVGFHDGLGAHAEGGELHGATIVSANAAIRFVSVLADDPEDFLARVHADQDVQYVEEMPLLQMIEDVGAQFTPNDPQYSSQYGPSQVRLPSAWDVTRGSTGAAVCVLDTGIRYTHEDLAGSRYMGGRDWINNDNDPWDDQGHGTHVSGTAAATIHNGIGVAGMGNVAHYAVKVLNSGGSGTHDAVANGITWCADNTPSRTVLSMSLGSTAGSTTLQNAVNYAYNTKGKLVVAAAGNGACENCVNYPAAYDSVVAVTCTRSGESLCSFSSTGPEAELAAPGESIRSTCYESNTAYCSKSGTSMSTPHVSGVAALFWSHAADLTASQLRARLQQSAQDLGPSGRDADFGYGELDAACLFGLVTGCPGYTPPPCTGPANNCFGTATSASGPSYAVTQSTAGATTEAGEPAPCGEIGATVWYRYTPSASTRLFIDTLDSTYDTVLAVYTGSSLGSLSNVGCSDDVLLGTRSQLEFNAVAGATYYVQAGGYRGATGTLVLRIQHGPDCLSGVDAPNTFGAALAIVRPTSCEAYLEPILGADWYRFSATSGQSMALTVERPLTAPDMTACLYTPSNVLAACVPSLGSTLTHVASTSGEWRVRVGSLTGYGTYSMAVS